MNISARKTPPESSSDILNNIDWRRVSRVVENFDRETRTAAQQAADHMRQINRATTKSENGSWEEKRDYPRNRVGLYVGLTCGQMNGYHRARDMSMTGIFIETEHRILPGAEVLLSIPFANQDRHVKMKGTVVRATEDGIGIRFDPFDIAIGQ